MRSITSFESALMIFGHPHVRGWVSPVVGVAELRPGPGGVIGMVACVVLLRPSGVDPFSVMGGDVLGEIELRRGIINFGVGAGAKKIHRAY